MGTIKEEIHSPIHELKQEPDDTVLDVQFSFYFIIH